METHEFTFIVEQLDIHDDAGLDRLYEAGCDDASFVLMQGVSALCFDREANSFLEAVLSAFKDVSQAGAVIRRFEPDFLVTRADIAKRANLSKQAISNYVKGDRAALFPKPVMRVSSESPLWDWVEVSRWLVTHKKIDEVSYRNAQISRYLNQSFQSSQAPEEAQLSEELYTLISQPITAEQHMI